MPTRSNKTRRPSRKPEFKGTPYDLVITRLEAAGCEPERGARGKGNWHCPAHEDDNPSLSVDEAEDGKVLLHCYSGCSAEDIVTAIDLRMSDLFPQTNGHRRHGTSIPQGEPVATYVYQDERGGKLFRKLRFEARDGKKTFVIERYEDGEWIPGLNGTRQVPYRLPYVIQGVKNHKTIYITEGEKDAERLKKETGGITTTTPGGASAAWDESWNEYFRDADVVIVADNNDPAPRKDKRNVGLDRANRIRYALEPVVASVKVLLPPMFGDISDVFDAKLDLEDCPEIEPPSEEELALDELPLTELGNARRLVAAHGQDLRFCSARKTSARAGSGWFVWDGKRWAPDVTGEVMRRAKQVVLQMHHDALEEFDPNLIKWALASQSAAKLKAMVELAQTEKGIAVHLDQLDVDPWLLNCENGTVNLKTLEIHEHRREDLCTRITACPYDPRAKDPVWDKFLRGVLPDADIRTYIQTAAGYTITGDDAEGIMLLAHGPTHTGKTTFLEAIKATLGSYAVTMAIETISRSRHGREPGRARSDLVRLYGARFVSSTEAPENVQLDEARVKEMTGGDTNVARTLYAEEVEATPSWTVWVGSNYRPKVNNADDAVWNRLIELPFTHQHTGKAKDMTIRPHFKRSKKAHAAILSWLIEGLGRYNTDGLIQPAAIMQLTEEYRQQMNPLMPWIDQCGVLDPKAWTSAKRLRESYREFTGHFPGDRMFGQSLARLPGVTEGRRREGGMRQRGWAGIGLLRDDERKWDNDEEED